MHLEKVIILLSIVVIFLIGYSILSPKENFEQVDICDYDSPDPTMFCKSIQKGCTDLLHENNNLNKGIKERCTDLPTSTKDLIDVAITCSDDTDKVIMNQYVQNEVCSQIKNFPGVTLSPTSDIISVDISKIPEQRVFSPATFTASQENEYVSDYYLNKIDYAPF
jgi:hypothetical protein